MIHNFTFLYHLMILPALPIDWWFATITPSFDCNQHGADKIRLKAEITGHKSILFNLNPLAKVNPKLKSWDVFLILIETLKPTAENSINSAFIISGILPECSHFKTNQQNVWLYWLTICVYGPHPLTLWGTRGAKVARGTVNYLKKKLLAAPSWLSHTYSVTQICFR